MNQDRAIGLPLQPLIEGIEKIEASHNRSAHPENGVPKAEALVQFDGVVEVLLGESSFLLWGGALLPASWVIPTLGLS